MPVYWVHVKTKERGHARYDDPPKSPEILSYWTVGFSIDGERKVAMLVDAKTSSEAKEIVRAEFPNWPLDKKSVLRLRDNRLTQTFPCPLWAKPRVKAAGVQEFDPMSSDEFMRRLFDNYLHRNSKDGFAQAVETLIQEYHRRNGRYYERE